MESFESELESIVYEAPDSNYKVLRVRRKNDDREITAVGELPDVAEGQTLSLTGNWTHHDRFGRQFQIEQVDIHEPASEEGIQNYLASSLLKGIGPELAERITDEFGENTLDIMDEDIDRLKDVSGIGSSKLEQIKKDWNEQRHMRDVMLFLKEHGVSTAYSRKIYEEYEDESLQFLRENPYRLCEDVEGIGFKIADKIARKLGMKEGDDARLEAGLEHVLVEGSEEGDVYLQEDELIEKAREILDVSVESIEIPLKELEKQNRIVRENGDNPVVYLKSLFNAENRVAEKLKKLMRADREPEDPSKEKQKNILDDLQSEPEFEYNEKQLNAIRMTMSERVVILTGGPGTGKTTTVVGMLEAMKSLDWTIKLAAPTGRAAQRMEEATGHSASTIHRLLGYQPPNTYEKDEYDPIDADAVIVDELSMVDLWLMDRLLRAVQKGTRLILVGDADQLPSVGPGDILNDLITSGDLPIVKLSEIFRQANRSRIVQSAHRINEGEIPELDNDVSGDFFFLEQSDPQKARNTIVNLVSERLPDHYNLDPFEEIQVVAPMYKGQCGVNQLNENLQNTINPGRESDSMGKENFREGDRIMQLENNYEKDIFNGDIGRITRIDRTDEKLYVDFPGAKPISYSKESLGQITLAYAITIHKSQGSEFEAVIIPILTQHYIMLQRNLLYTALTRARELAVLVGTPKAVGMAVNNAKDRKRNTRLPQRLES